MALGTLRELSTADASAIAQVMARDPIANVFAAARWRDGIDLAPLLWGWGRGGELESVCYLGANLVPVCVSREAAAAFAGPLRHRTGCCSIVGPAAAVGELWRQLAPTWPIPREVRSQQPVLVTSAPALISGDPAVRLATEADLPALYPATIAMYTEELGASPVAVDGGAYLRRRVAELVVTRHVYVLQRAGELIFKAEIGSVANGVCQLQGVWVDPRFRGVGIGTAAMASVTTDAIRRVAPTVSLYVNEENIAARRAYERCGYHQQGTFATVLF